MCMREIPKLSQSLKKIKFVRITLMHIFYSKAKFKYFFVVRVTWKILKKILLRIKEDVIEVFILKFVSGAIAVSIYL